MGVCSTSIFRQQIDIIPRDVKISDSGWVQTWDLLNTRCVLTINHHARVEPTFKTYIKYMPQYKLNLLVNKALHLYNIQSQWNIYFTLLKGPSWSCSWLWGETMSLTVATNWPTVHPHMIYEHVEPWQNDTDRAKLLFHPPDLSGNLTSSHLSSKAGGSAKDIMKFALQSISFIPRSAFNMP
jgi:hypothetical protein